MSSGPGGWAAPALLYLTAAGVGRITIVDPDAVELSNLQRQILYGVDDQGLSKVEVATRRLRELDPLVHIDPRRVKLQRKNALDLVGSCDLVVDGSDNFATRYLVNDACVLEGRPFVYGAVQGFEGQVSVFNWKDGPTYRCLFPEPPMPGSVPNCAEAGVLGAVTGFIGTAQAVEAIKVLSGVGEPLSGRLLVWNALTMTPTLVTVPRDPAGRRITALPPEGYGETCAVPGPVAEDEIGREELRRLIGSGSPLQLLDVREDWERVIGLDRAVGPRAPLAAGDRHRGRHRAPRPPGADGRLLLDGGPEPARDSDPARTPRLPGGDEPAGRHERLAHRHPVPGLKSGAAEPIELMEGCGPSGFTIPWAASLPTTLDALRLPYRPSPLRGPAAMNTPFCVLTIAGSDSGGGAGIQADQRTIRSIGGHALTAVTAVTAQDTETISAWLPVEDRLIASQIASALASYPVAAVKTGLLPGAGAVEVVAEALAAKTPALPLVVDPVLASTSGTVFLDRRGLEVLRKRLLPLATLVTPNWPEAAALFGPHGEDPCPGEQGGPEDRR